MNEHCQQLLAKSDQALFTEGGCHVFALELAKAFGYSMKLLRNEAAQKPGGIAHVYCTAGGLKIDFTGIEQESRYLKTQFYDFPPYRASIVSRKQLAEFLVRDFGKGGLIFSFEFFRRACRRARAIIVCNRTKYDVLQ